MVDQPPFRREAVAAPVYISWGAVIAGAIAASALTFVLITFGAAIGLAIASPSATWRDTSVALALLSGLWLLLTAVASFALGGYLAGRLRATWDTAVAEVVEFRDGIHGILVWGLAIVIGASLALGAVRAAAPQATGNALAPSAATAEPLLAFELDRLFRADRRPNDAVDADMRAQAARIITTSFGHADMAAEDAVRHGQAVEMDPMGSNERRVVHEYLRDRPEIETYSEGDEPNRYVGVAPLLEG